MSEAIIIRVKLPPSSPVIHKTFKVAPTATVSSAIKDVIGKSLQQTVSVTSNWGLYLPSQHQWLEDNKLISDVQAAISSEEYVELKDREITKKINKTIATSELTYGLIGFLVGCVSTYFAIRINNH